MQQGAEDTSLGEAGVEGDGRGRHMTQPICGLSVKTSRTRLQRAGLSPSRSRSLTKVCGMVVLKAQLPIGLLMRVHCIVDAH